MEEGEDKGEGVSGKKPKAKAKSRGKAKTKATPKGKGEPKAPKARGRPKKNKELECEIEGRDLPLEEPIEECEEPETPEASAEPMSGGGVPKSDDTKDGMNDDKKEEKEKESEEPPVPEPSKPPRKRRAGVKASVVQEEAGESEKPQKESRQVKRKDTKEKEKSSEKKSRASRSEKDPKEAAKKARTGDGPATFARRAYPRSDYGKMKWDNLKAIFNSMIRAKVVQPSKREDLGHDKDLVFAQGPSLHLQKHNFVPSIFSAWDCSIMFHPCQSFIFWKVLLNMFFFKSGWSILNIFEP